MSPPGETTGGSVGLVVNCYERTYLDVLRPGFVEAIAAQNLRSFDEVAALINNVADPRAARLPERALRRRPHLLDYGVVMRHVVTTDWLLGERIPQLGGSGVAPDIGGPDLPHLILVARRTRDHRRRDRRGVR